jgi:hypothetical protein
MQIITNTQIIESRTKWAKWISVVGLGCLLGGFAINIMSFSDPSLSSTALMFLVLGILASMVSSKLVSFWIREPRADQFLSDALRKFGNDYFLFNYTVDTINLLLTPTRLYVVIVKNQDGKINVDGSKFSKKFTWRTLMRIFAADGLGTPVNEAEKSIKKVRKLLGKNLISTENIPEVEALIVFSNKDVQLSVHNPTIPVIYYRDIRKYLKENDKQQAISETQRQELVEIIGGQYNLTKKGRK